MPRTVLGTSLRTVLGFFNFYCAAGFYYFFAGGRRNLTFGNKKFFAYIACSQKLHFGHFSF